MNKKGEETRDRGLYIKMTRTQRERFYKAAKRLGMSGADFAIAVSDDKVVDAVENKIRQNFDVKTNAKVVV